MILRWLRRLLGVSGDVYIVVDLFDAEYYGVEDGVLSVHARLQGAELAAAAYAERHGEAEYPAMGSRQLSIERLRDRLVIVNRDVQDDDE